jgi:N-methylhydantoinase A
MGASNDNEVVLAFDVGGTFTDVVIFASGTLKRMKIPSNPDTAALGDQISRMLRAELDALQAAANGDPAAQPVLRPLVHGTTVGSNAVLEGKGAKVGVITTAGFRDELELRRLSRPGIYDTRWERPPPLVERYLRQEVDERISAAGELERVPDDEVIKRIADRFGAQGVEAIAVCCINSYVNSQNEDHIRGICQDVLPDTYVCGSAEVLPEIREYERMSTTALNAYLTPVVGRYIASLEEALASFGVPLSLMQSNGGIMTSTRARERPIYMIESGPAAGVLAAASLADHLDLERVVVFDMGGTTAKVCLIDDGRPVERPEMEVGSGANMSRQYSSGAGYVLRVPSFDLVEVGAGGGSIAWIDEGGVLRVGPSSAGAEPGPACYGRGGTEATVTDANVVLGRISPGEIAGGTVTIDRERALQAVGRAADQLGMSAIDVAHGITEVANATMVRAIRAVTTERGRDPRDFDMIAFGGAGPVHACELAERMGITRVIVPPIPGLFSAVGLLMAEVRTDFVRSIATSLADDNEDAIVEQFRALETEGVAIATQGIAVEPEAVRVEWRADLRYGRQQSELTVDIQPADVVRGLFIHLRQRFDAMHSVRFGYDRPDDAVHLVNIRVRVVVPTSSDGRPEALWHCTTEDVKVANGESRDMYFQSSGAVQSTIVERRSLIANPRRGPIVIDEHDATVVVPPGWMARTDADGILHLEFSGEKAS